MEVEQMKLFRKLEEQPGFERRGNGWRCCCPAADHEDKRPSLDIDRGNNGKYILICRSRGCPYESILAGLGLSKNKQSNGRAEVKLGRAYHTVDQAIEAVARGIRKKHPDAELTEENRYETVEGGITYAVRFDWSDDKTFRLISCIGSSWYAKGLASQYLPFEYKKLEGHDRIHVCEGEKAARAAQSIGLVATTSIGGCKNAHNTDWRRLQGKEVVKLQDNDDDGLSYAQDVRQLVQPATSKIVLLPGLPKKGDIVDWIGNHGDAVEPESMCKEIEAIVEQAEAVVNKADRQSKPRVSVEDNEQRGQPVPEFEPFPIAALPQPCRDLLRAGEAAIGCDPAMIATPMICALASAIGATRRLQLKRTWSEPCVIWGGVVVRSGSHKSPAQDLAVDPLRKLQGYKFDSIAEAEDAYETNIKLYKADMAFWKRKGRSNKEPPPEEPKPPVVQRYLVDDFTLESLAPTLVDNPRGLLVDSDELTAWIQSFDKYRKGTGDVPRWLSIHRAQSITVDRKTGTRLLYIKRAALSVCGGIPPQTLRRVLGEAYFENGLAARMLLTSPLRRKKRWTEAEPDAETLSAYERVFARLLALQFVKDENDSDVPRMLRFDQGGKRAWVEFFNVHAEEEESMEEGLGAAWSKLEAYAARFALIIHLVRMVSGIDPPRSPDEVDQKSVQCGAELARWYGHEAERVYALLREAPADSERRQLIEWIKNRGGDVTERELQRGHRSFRGSGHAAAALQKLVKDGCGRWVNVKPDTTGGRPSRFFQLTKVVDKTS